MKPSEPDATSSIDVDQDHLAISHIAKIPKCRNFMEEVRAAEPVEVTSWGDSMGSKSGCPEEHAPWQPDMLGKTGPELPCGRHIARRSGRPVDDPRASPILIRPTGLRSVVRISIAGEHRPGARSGAFVIAGDEMRIRRQCLIRRAVASAS